HGYACVHEPSHDSGTGGGEVFRRQGDASAQRAQLRYQIRGEERVEVTGLSIAPEDQVGPSCVALDSDVSVRERVRTGIRPWHACHPDGNDTDDYPHRARTTGRWLVCHGEPSSPAVVGERQ